MAQVSGCTSGPLPTPRVAVLSAIASSAIHRLLLSLRHPLGASGRALQVGKDAFAEAVLLTKCVLPPEGRARG